MNSHSVGCLLTVGNNTLSHYKRVVHVQNHRFRSVYMRIYAYTKDTKVVSTLHRVRCIIGELITGKLLMCSRITASLTAKADNEKSTGRIAD